MSECKASNEEILSYLRDLAKRLGRTPRRKDIGADPNKPGYSSMTVIRRFGSWNEALTAAGFNRPSKCCKYPKKTKEELISLIKDLAEKLGRTPFTREFAVYSGIRHTSPTLRRYGGWGELVTSAGLDYIYQEHHYSEEELIEQVKKLAKKLKRPPLVQEFNSCKYTAHSTAVKKRFGTWQNFLEAAGLASRYDEDTLINQLRDLAEKLGKTPTEREFNREPHTASYRTVLRKFGSWQNFLKASGLAT